MQDFWAQNPMALSLELSTVIFAAIIVVLIAKRSHASVAIPTQQFLTSKTALSLFIFLRYFIGGIGAISLIVTFLPGLMPFKDRIDDNVGLGGIMLFFLWPIIIIQVIIAFQRLEKYLTKEPVLLWILLVVVGYIALQIDYTAVDLVYILD